ncbi:MAG: hypothetical protein KatS3mg064_2403 [Tepidiforma sp.]|nr:hypothetical protein [Tepidiforma sp.]GIW19246.1 MAG: hypothetical protein KatS3mg064_2403 [Tepidiforma sp.]
MTMSRARVVIGAALVALVLGAAGFALGRQIGGEEGSPPAAAAGTPAAPTATPAGTAPTATPAGAAPTATPTAAVDPHTGLSLDPDTSKPFWADPYHEADLRLPRFDGVIAGVHIGPGAGDFYDPTAWCDDPAWYSELSVTRGSRVELPLVHPIPGGLPPHAIYVLSCSGRGPVGASASYSLPVIPGLAPFGGALSVNRVVVDREPPAVSLHLPAPRVREMEVAGAPAAVAVPILPDLGVGITALVTYRDGVLTWMQGNMPLPLLLQFAEAILGETRP